jgi:hypothetical protein
MKKGLLRVPLFIFCGSFLYISNGHCATVGTVTTVLTGIGAAADLGVSALWFGKGLHQWWYNGERNREYQNAWKSCGGVVTAIGATAAVIVLSKKHLRACGLVDRYRKKLESDYMNEFHQKQFDKAVLRRNILRLELAVAISALLVGLYCGGRYASNHGRAMLFMGSFLGSIGLFYGLALAHGRS